MLLQFSVLDNAMHDTEKNGGQQLLSPEAPGRAAAGLRLRVQFTVILKSAVLGFDCENSSLELLVKFRYLELNIISII